MSKRFVWSMSDIEKWRASVNPSGARAGKPLTLCVVLVAAVLWGLVLPMDVHAQVPDISLRQVFKLQLCLGAFSFFSYLVLIGLVRLLRGFVSEPAERDAPASGDAQASRVRAGVESPELQSREREARR